MPGHTSLISSARLQTPRSKENEPLPEGLEDESEDESESSSSTESETETETESTESTDEDSSDGEDGAYGSFKVEMDDEAAVSAE